MVQEPEAIKVMVVPFVPVQVATEVSELLNTIAFPEAPPVAETVNGASPNVFEGSALKMIDWLFTRTVKV